MDIAIPTLPSRSLPATLAFYRRLGFSGKLDTSPQIEQRQIDAWRQMSPADKAATITALTRAAYRDAGALVS